MTAIILPPLGEGVIKATVVCWHKQQGQPVAIGEDVCEVVTDKATFNIEASATGVLSQILVQEGQEAAIGANLGVIA